MAEEAYVYETDPDEVFESLDDFPGETALEPCPVCDGGDTMEFGVEIIDDCPACVEGYIPHGRCLDVEVVDDEPDDEAMPF